MKLAFFGSSSFSIPVLKSLAASKHSVDLIVTTPPAKQGRGQKEKPSEVEVYCQLAGLSCLSPHDIKSEEFTESLRSLGIDAFAVASYGKMLPDTLLSIPKKIPLNVHPSLLPKYRGAAPIARQLWNGETESGVSIAKITSHLDAGEILAQRKMTIEMSDDAISLRDKLAELGGELLLEVLDQIEMNRHQLIPQNESLASYAAKLKKEMGRIDWNQNASKIHDQIRALVPWPAAYTFFNGKRIKLLKAAVEASVSVTVSHHTGTIIKIDPEGYMSVQAKQGVVKLLMIQPESGKEMNPHAFSIGSKLKPGDQFS